MLEGVVSTILTKYLGKYVAGLERENLQLSLGTGEVVLENLALRQDALDELELPVTVKAGLVGKLTLRVPWKQISSEPVVIIIDNVLVLACPKPPAEYDSEEVQNKRLQTKLRRLQLWELLQGSEDGGDDEEKKRRKIVGQDGLEGDSDGEEVSAEEKKKAAEALSWTQQLINTMVNNIQVFVNNVHFRYEDDVSDGSQPFAVGVTLRHLHAETTDANWIPAFLSHAHKKIFKRISLRELGVYWDTDILPTFSEHDKHEAEDMPSLISALLGNAALDEKEKSDREGKRHGREVEKGSGKMEEEARVGSKAWSSYHYLIEPISGDMRAIIFRTSAAAIAQSQPKFYFDFVLNNIRCKMEENQLHDMLHLHQRFSTYHTSIKYRQYRPLVNVKRNPSAWWRFAILSVLYEIHEHHQEWSWEYISQVNGCDFIGLRGQSCFSSPPFPIFLTLYLSLLLFLFSSSLLFSFLSHFFSLISFLLFFFFLLSFFKIFH